MTPTALSARTLPLARRAALLGVAILLADFLFFDQPVGLSAALFLAALTGMLILETPGALQSREFRAAMILPAATLPALLEAVTPLSVAFALLSGISLALAERVTWYRDPQRWLEAAVAFAGHGVMDTIADARRAPDTLRQGGRPLDTLAAARSWLMPVLLSLVFVGLFTLANPVLSGFLSDLLKLDGDLFDTLARLLFWIAAAFVLWPVLRAGLADADPGLPNLQGLLPPLLPEAPRSGVPSLADLAGPRPVLRSLVLFNGLFAVQTLLDLTYLTGGLGLPDGMRYADYAHRGAYPLVAAALLAGGFVVFAIRPGTPMERDPLVRRLVLVWVGQTLVLLATSVWRLDLYVSVYSLTYLRAAAFIWMALVGLGLLWILARLFLNRSNRWLIKANLLTLAAVLHACCFIDFGATIATFNVQDAPRTASRKLDVDYLTRIGAAAIPALDKVVRDETLPSHVRTRAYLSTKWHRARVVERAGNWRAFSFRQYRLSRYIAANPLQPLRIKKPTGDWVRDQYKR